MSKPRIIIWGGNRKPLALETLDSHASVTAFFLTKYLTRFYDVVTLVDVDAPEEILQQRDIHAVISTFQRGFTNRLILKGKEEVFRAIRTHVKGPLCSVYDFNYDDTPYVEDIVFTVRPPNERNTRAIRRRSANPNIQLVHMGWCADAELCTPDLSVPSGDVHVFLDHPSYTPGARDVTRAYLRALNDVARQNPDLALRVYQQRNEGVVELDVTRALTEGNIAYDRHRKVPWPEMIRHYRRMHVFCITSPQSACLSAIEAAMCGARIYIPRYRWRTPFIPNDLLDGQIPFASFRENRRAMARVFMEDIGKGFSRGRSPHMLTDHTWADAADRIHRALSPS